LTLLSLHPSDYVKGNGSESESKSQAIVTAKLSADSTPTSLPPKSTTTDTTNDAEVRQQGFPSLTLSSEKGTAVSPATQTGSDSGQKYAGALNVLQDLRIGVENEVVDHTTEVILSAGMGVACGALAGLMAPEAVATAGVIGLLCGGYEVAKNAPNWIHDAEVVASPNDYTAAQQAQADRGVESVGAGVALVAAGGVGSSVGGPLNTELAVERANLTRVGVCSLASIKNNI
jgi:hypothetical protein